MAEVQYDEARVGDVIIDSDWPEKECMSQGAGYLLCTRHPGHKGQHVAEGMADNVLGVWN